jgi:cephalosporin-C deacetylase-like acetyl esterase
MKQVRVRRGGKAETDDVEELKARIADLEAQLERRAAPSPSSGGGGEAIKVAAAGLGATTVVLAWPAFLTFRRWVRWWRE